MPRSSSFTASRAATWNASINGPSAWGLTPFASKCWSDRERRAALHDRFVYSQKFAQHDPWAERAGGKDAHEFAPLADLKLMEAAE